MIARLKVAVTRSEVSLVEDILGVTVLFAVLFAALALPGTI